MSLEEEEEGVKEKGEEKYIFLEEFSTGSFVPLTYDRLVKLIPKVESGRRVRVFRRGRYFIPLTSVGCQILSAYKTVGFSYVPSIIVEDPKKGERDERDENELRPFPGPRRVPQVQDNEAMRNAFNRLNQRLGFLDEVPIRG